MPEVFTAGQLTPIIRIVKQRISGYIWQHLGVRMIKARKKARRAEHKARAPRHFVEQCARVQERARRSAIALFPLCYVAPSLPHYSRIDRPQARPSDIFILILLCFISTYLMAENHNTIILGNIAPFSRYFSTSP